MKKGNKMINLAGVETADRTIRKELRKAKILVVKCASQGEVPYNVVGKLRGWTFRRAWYYYVAVADENCAIDINTAELFHQKWGQVVRVDGHCGCPSPKEWWSESWSKADTYHIDTQEGLNAFANLLREIANEREQDEN